MEALLGSVRALLYLNPQPYAHIATTVPSLQALLCAVRHTQAFACMPWCKPGQARTAVSPAAQTAGSSLTIHMPAYHQLLRNSTLPHTMPLVCSADGLQVPALDTAPHHVTCLLCRWAAGASTRHCPTPCHLFALQMGCRCQKGPCTLFLQFIRLLLAQSQAPCLPLLLHATNASLQATYPLPIGTSRCCAWRTTGQSLQHTTNAAHGPQLISTHHCKQFTWPMIDQHIPLHIKMLRVANDQSAHVTAHNPHASAPAASDVHFAARGAAAPTAPAAPHCICSTCTQLPAMMRLLPAPSHAPLATPVPHLGLPAVVPTIGAATPAGEPLAAPHIPASLPQAVPADAGPVHVLHVQPRGGPRVEAARAGPRAHRLPACVHATYTAQAQAQRV